jgi:hypothetical protein
MTSVFREFQLLIAATQDEAFSVHHYSGDQRSQRARDPISPHEALKARDVTAQANCPGERAVTYRALKAQVNPGHFPFRCATLEIYFAPLALRNSYVMTQAVGRLLHYAPLSKIQSAVAGAARFVPL